MRSLTLLGALLVALTMQGCRRQEKFPKIGDKLASPVDVAVSDSGDYFYVLNADFDRTYNRGSLLVLDHDGNRVSAVELPRMGRSITVSGDVLFVTVDYQDDKQNPQAMLFSIKDNTNPVLAAQWELDCSPFNASFRKGSDYFAMTCLDGPLFVGKLDNTDLSKTTFKKVRNYGISRRAIYIDPVRNLIFGFTTDASKQTWADLLTYDAGTWDDLAVQTSTEPDEIPDSAQNTRAAESSKGSRQIHQFFVYDLAAESKAQPGCVPVPTDDCTLPFRTNEEALVISELRWMYFKLSNFDGTPDIDPIQQNDNTLKYYRTNFYAAQPDPDDPDVFYLSHRGPPKDTGSPHANQVVKVTIVGDPRADTTVAPPLAPHTGDIFNFERVYGFKGGEVSPLHYPGDIKVVKIAGQKMLLINHFRDLVNWVRGDVYFSIAAKSLDDTGWFTETTNNLDPKTSWFQIAVNNKGRAMSCSFYGNAVEVLDVVPGVGINEVRRVE